MRALRFAIVTAFCGVLAGLVAGCPAPPYTKAEERALSEKPAAPPKPAEPKPLARWRAQGMIEALVFSPDGELLAGWGRRGNAQVWSARSGEPAVTLHGADRASDLSFSERGNFIGGVGSPSGKPVGLIWNTASGEIARQFGEDVASAALAPRGTFFGTGSGLYGRGKRALEVWSAADGTLIQELKLIPIDPKKTTRPTWPDRIAFSPDASLLAVHVAERSTRGRTLLQFFSLPDGAPVSQADYSGSLESLSFSSDGAYLAIHGSGNFEPQYRAVRVFDARKGTQVHAFEQPADSPAVGMAVAAQANIVAISERNPLRAYGFNRIRFFELPRGPEIGAIAWSGGWAEARWESGRPASSVAVDALVGALAISPVGDKIASAVTRDKETWIYVWPVPDPVRSRLQPKPPIASAGMPAASGAPSVPQPAPTTAGGPARNQPPFVTLYPAADCTSRETLTISGRARDDSAVRGIRVVRNGVDLPDAAERGIAGVRRAGSTGSAAAPAPAAEREFSFTVPLVEGKNTITVIAEDDGGLEGQDTKSVTRISEQGRTLALVVGVGKYGSDRVPTLEFADKDATAVRDLLVASLGAAAADVRLLTNDAATRGALLKGLQALRKDAGPADRIIFFYAGHGLPGDIPPAGGEPERYLAPVDVDPEPDALVASGVSMSDVSKVLGGSQARETILILDACYAGAAGLRSAGEPSADTISRALITGRGRVLLASSRKTEPSREDKARGHGMFTSFVLEGLGGAADADRDGFVDTGELAQFVSAGVERATGGAQRPVYKADVESPIRIALPRR